MRKWLARLAFSFIVIAAVLAWEGHKRGGRISYYIAAAVFVGLGITGMRERHRREATGHSSTDERR